MVHEHYVHLFQRLDLDGDGKISPWELSTCMRTIGHDLPVDDAAELMEAVDSDGDGQLGLEDLVALVGEEEEGQEERERGLREAFGVYAMEGTGCITPTSLRRALDRLGSSKEIDECEFMIRSFDLDGDGVLSFHEFKVMML